MPLTPEKIELVKRLYQEGKTWREIQQIAHVYARRAKHVGEAGRVTPMTPLHSIAGITKR
jgi:hypothetical protein